MERKLLCYDCLNRWRDMGTGKAELENRMHSGTLLHVGLSCDNCHDTLWKGDTIGCLTVATRSESSKWVKEYVKNPVKEC